MKRYMMLVNFDGGTVEEPMDEWKPDEVEAHMDYYRALNKELRETGELVEVRRWRGLTWRRSSRPTASPRPSSPTGRSRRSRSGSPAT